MNVFTEEKIQTSNSSQNQIPTTEESKEKVYHNLEADEFEDTKNLDSEDHFKEYFNSDASKNLVPIDILYAAKNCYVLQMVKKGYLKPIVVKMPRKYKSKNMEQIEKEVVMSEKISKLGQKYFVQFVENHRVLLKGMDTQILIFECGLDSMENILKARKPYIESEIIFILQNQICPALKILHNNKIFHFDVKPANIILFEENGEYFYKIGDFGSALKNLYQCSTISYSLFYSELGIEEMIKNDSNFSLSGHDVYTLVITILEMMGLSKNEIGEIKQKASLTNLAPKMKEEYKNLIPILEKNLKKTNSIFEFIEELEKFEAKKPNEVGIINSLQNENLLRFLQNRGNKPNGLEDDTGFFLQSLALNRLKYLTQDLEQYYTKVSKIINKMRKRLGLTHFSKNVLKIFCFFEGCEMLENWIAAEDSLNQLKESLRREPSENSEIRNFFLLLLYLFLFYRSNNKEGMIKTEEEIYWKSCNCLTPLSFIGNFLENFKMRMFFGQFLGLSFFHQEHFSIKNCENLSQTDFKQTKPIEDFIKEFNKVLEKTVTETESGDLQGFESCKKPTLAYKLYEYLPIIYQNRSFQNDKYVTAMEFQFFQLLESGNKEPEMLKKLLKVFPLLLGNENSFLYAEMLILYIPWAKSKKKSHFKKALNIFQSIRLKFNDGELMKKRIDNLKKLKRSYKLFRKYETREVKLKEMNNDIQIFKKIREDLEKTKFDGNFALTEYLIKIQCPFICQYLIFCDLVLEDDLNNIYSFRY